MEDLDFNMYWSESGSISAMFMNDFAFVSYNQRQNTIFIFDKDYFKLYFSNSSKTYYWRQRIVFMHLGNYEAKTAFNLFLN